MATKAELEELKDKMESEIEELKEKMESEKIALQDVISGLVADSNQQKEQFAGAVAHASHEASKQIDERIEAAVKKNTEEMTKTTDDITSELERVRIELDSIKANAAAQHQSTLECIHEFVKGIHNKGNKGKSLANPSETSVDKLTEG